jgi:hypothetical protein
MRLIVTAWMHGRVDRLDAWRKRVVVACEGLTGATVVARSVWKVSWMDTVGEGVGVELDEATEGAGGRVQVGWMEQGLSRH